MNTTPQVGDRGNVASIVLVNCREWRLTLACMESFARLSYPNHRVLVIENGSPDESASRIQEWITRRDAAGGVPGQFELLCQETNLGFAGGCNVGIRKALAEGADYVWLLNNDTECDADALSALVECSRTHDGALASSNIVMMNEPERVWFQGGRFNPVLGTARHTTFAEFGQLPRRRFLTGCSLLLPRGVIDRVGLLDERFFVYFEDIDYCIRAESQGVGLQVALGSRVRHHGSGTNGLRTEFAHRTNARSAILFTAKHYPGFVPAVAALRVLKALAYMGLGRLAPALGTLRGTLSGLRRALLPASGARTPDGP